MVDFLRDNLSQEVGKKYNEGRWTKVEHEIFLKGLSMFGKEWKKIATLIPTRSIVQVRTHAQKYFQKVARVKFEKRGIKVPEALRSTAIKSDYNFEALQKALLNEQEPPLVGGFMKSKQRKYDPSFMDKNINTINETNIENGVRRSRRKASKISVNLQNLAQETEERPVEDFGYDYNFAPITIDNTFDFNKTIVDTPTSISGSEIFQNESGINLQAQNQGFGNSGFDFYTYSSGGLTFQEPEEDILLNELAFNNYS